MNNNNKQNKNNLNIVWNTKTTTFDDFGSKQKKNAFKTVSKKKKKIH